MSTSEYQYAFSSRSLVREFYFGTKSISDIDSLLIKGKDDSIIAEYPLFPGRSLFDRKALETELQREDKSQSALKILNYCFYQIDFHRNFQKSDFQPIAINAVIGAEYSNVQDEILESVSKGFESIKLKITPKNASRVLDTLISIAPDLKKEVRFRLDSNAAFQANEVIDLSVKLQELPIEYWEDPIPYKDHYQYQYMTKESPFPIAIDEPIDSLETGLKLLKEKCCHVLVLKPAQILDMDKLEAAIQADPSVKSKIVLSSLFEGYAGNRFIVRLAGKLGLQKLAHGLDTLRFFDSTQTMNPIVLNSDKQFEQNQNYYESVEWRAL